MPVKDTDLPNGALAAAEMVWPAVIVASAVAVAATCMLAAYPPARPVAAFWFLLVCPGMAFVPLLPIGDRLVQFGLAVVLSIALDGVVSEAMLATKASSEQTELAVLIGICLTGTMLQLRRAWRRTTATQGGGGSRR